MAGGHMTKKEILLTSIRGRRSRQTFYSAGTWVRNPISDYLVYCFGKRHLSAPRWASMVMLSVLGWLTDSNAVFARLPLFMEDFRKIWIWNLCEGCRRKFGFTHYERNIYNCCILPSGQLRCSSTTFKDLRNNPDDFNYNLKNLKPLKKLLKKPPPFL